MQQIYLSDLLIGFPAISKNVGAYLAEGVAYCLETSGHKSGVVLKVSGTLSADIQVLWEQAINSQVQRAWADTLEATEFGAIGIAILLVQLLTEFTIIERSARGTGFDYWLGTGEYDENKLPFDQRKARLEVSGIWKASPTNSIDARIEIKKRQVEKSDHLGLPVLIIVVEFGTPASKILQQ